MPVDPLTSGGLPPGFADIIAHELAALAADAKTLQTRLATGDVVQAVVLSSNGLTDLLNIGGLRVAAELPSTLLPGETISVEVTGFTGDRINLHILPNATPPNATPPVTSAPASASARTASNAIATAADGPPLASSAQAQKSGEISGSSLHDDRLALHPVNLQVSAVRSQPVVSAGLRSIEARLATAQATAAPAPPPGSTVTREGLKRVLPGADFARVAAAPGTLRPVIAPRGSTAPPTAVPAAFPVTRGPADYSEPAKLLRGLLLPLTATNVAAARLALQSPEKLPAALQALESALDDSADPRIPTLRTLVAFLSRIEPRSPVLATQIAAFVDHVVTGRESKVAQLLSAHAQASEQSGSAQPSVASAAERVAVRQAALDYDLKTLLLAVEKGAGNGAGVPKQELTAAVGRALTAVTALQLGAATTLAAHPDGLEFSLPIALPNGFARAQVRIDRDAPDHTNVPLDGDNFHIAFVLETQHLGTVAIDVFTVGRAVTLSVQTEAIPAQQAFGTALNRLTHRLEALHYRVAKAAASVAPRAPVTPPAAVSAAVPDPSHAVDLDA